MVMKGVMNVVNDMTLMSHMTTEMTPIECGMKCMNSNRPEGVTEQDEEDEMLAKFWADYGESLWVDPMEQEWMLDEKTN
jgi:hypothetical protein